jgi:hypothetical protein
MPFIFTIASPQGYEALVKECTTDEVILEVLEMTVSNAFKTQTGEVFTGADLKALPVEQSSLWPVPLTLIVVARWTEDRARYEDEILQQLEHAIQWLIPALADSEVRLILAKAA